MSEPTQFEPDPDDRQRFTQAFGASATWPGAEPKVRVRIIAGVAAVVVAGGVALGVGMLDKPSKGSKTVVDDAAHAAASAGKRTTASTPAHKASSSTGAGRSTSAPSAGGGGGGGVSAAAASTREQSAGPSINPVGQLVVVKNGAGQAYAFALSSDGTLVYAAQSSTGPGSWSAFQELPGTPTDAVSAPAAVTDQDGHLEVFARVASGQIVDGWQTSSGGWSWDGAVTGGALPGTAAGSPNAVLRADGTVQVFVRLSDGSVIAAAQRQANGPTGWTGWSSLGGALSGNPVPFNDSDGDVDLFGRSTSGTLVADFLSGGSWTGWSALGSSPGGLAYDPDPIANANGVTEVLVTTASGGMDGAEGSGGESWNWSVPLAGANLGSAIVSPPSALQWSDGHLEVFARLANGELAHAWQNAPNGVTDWASWGTLPGAAGGSPVALSNGDGTPEVLMPTGSASSEFDYWRGSEWSAPVVMTGTL